MASRHAFGVVVTFRNGPKVNSLPCVTVMSHLASGYMLENPSICPVLVLACVGDGQ
jgi:hypothetical protein